MNHLGGYFVDGDRNTYTPDIWGWLLLKYGINSVVDIGCGTAVNLKWFKDMGCKVLGVEGHVDAVARAVCGPIVVHDYTTGPFGIPIAINKSPLPRPFDLCLCTEFVEHVESRYEENWLATMCDARYVLMSHATPGQGGHHHVNEQPAEYWIKRLAEYEFKHIAEDTLVMRQTLARRPSRWGRNTLMLFVNEGIGPILS